jgi:hypothetical protein
MPSVPPTPWPYGNPGSEPWIGAAPPRRSRKVMAILGPIAVGVLLASALVGAWFVFIAFLFATSFSSYGSNK